MESSHWRCGSCGARFTSEHPSPRCPKCLKNSLVERAEPTLAAAPVYAEARTRETPETPKTPASFASLAATVAAVGIVLATTWYLRGRSHLVSVELLITMVLGGLPGLALFYAFRALAGRPLLRVLLAAAALVTAAILVTSC